MQSPPTSLLPLVSALLLAAPAFLKPQAQAASWLVTGSMSTGRGEHTSTLLPNGKVLVAGGVGTNGFLAGAELYDPATGAWVATNPMSTPRKYHSATLLPNGKVLVVGGYQANTGSPGILSSAELYDPATGTWTATGPLHSKRARHTATLLPGGKVLVVGGEGDVPYLASTELYDPAAGTWTVHSTLATGRIAHSATLLSDGSLLVAGGFDSTGTIASVERYDPVTTAWTPAAPLLTARQVHTATVLPNHKLLVAGGASNSGDPLASAELYDPVAGTWTPAPSMASARFSHTANLLPGGRVLITGGFSTNSLNSALASAETYDPLSGTWSATSALPGPHAAHSATLLANGCVLVAGGDYFIGTFIYPVRATLYDSASGTWANTGSLNKGRAVHTATLLPNEEVLVTGGSDGNGILSSAELYDPNTGTWAFTQAMSTPRHAHTATLLSNGKVLVVGGLADSSGVLLSSTELYDSATGTWAASGALNVPRRFHTATLLANGKVLAAGGYSSNFVALATAEVYDPATGTWTPVGPMTAARLAHTATLLPNGKVLVTGGGENTLSSAELFNPATGTWSATASMGVPRLVHTATLLPNGKVLIAGGRDLASNVYQNSAELYDPAIGTWAAVPPLAVRRGYHTATLLPNGKVLIAGGSNGTYPGTAELYDPSVGKWTNTAALNLIRDDHTATLLPSGRVLIAGGNISGLALSSAELYDPGLGFLSDWQPQIISLTSPLVLNGALTLTGLRFTGIAEASSGNEQDSPANYPVVQLRNVENAQTVFLRSSLWSSNSFTSASVTGMPLGLALATVFVNGTPSNSRLVPVVRQLTAGDVTYTRVAGLSLRIQIAELLSHVTGLPADGAIFKLKGTGASGQGAFIITNSTYLLYTPANDNDDSFSYSVTDGNGASAMGTIFVSVIKITGPTLPPNSVRLNGTTATINAFGIPGYSYVLQTTTNIFSPWWPIGTNTASLLDGTLLFIDPNATNAQRYYRLAQP